MKKIGVFIGVLFVGFMMLGLVAGAGYNVVVPTAGDPPADSVSSGGGGAGGVPTYYPTVEKLIEGYTVVLRSTYQVKFDINDENHTLNVDSVEDSSVNITVSSEPQTKTLSVGDEAKFELDGDNVYDLSVKLNSISGSGAEMLMKTISEEIPEEEVVDEESLTGDTVKDVIEEKIAEVLSGKGNFLGLFVGILVFLGVVMGVIVYFKKRQ